MSGSAVVTGCGAGIGRAVFERLLADDFVVIGIEQDAASAAALLEISPGSEIVVGDTADRATLERAVAVAVAQAPLVAWVNNASLGTQGRLHELDPDDAKRVFDVNLMGYLWGASTAVRSFIEQRSGGAIVNVSSIHGRAGYPNWAVYNVCKGGVDALTRYIAVEYGPIGIRANAVAPGAVDTPLLRRTTQQQANPGSVWQGMIDAAPLRRIAAPEEVAAVVAFLIGDESRYITGQSIAVDGGLTAAIGPFALDSELARLYAGEERRSAVEQ